MFPGLNYWLPIGIESDCLEAVTMVNKKIGDCSRLSFVRDKIHELMKRRITCIAHTRHCQNVGSQYLSSFGRVHVRTTVWLGSDPGDVDLHCQYDCNI